MSRFQCSQINCTFVAPKGVGGVARESVKSLSNSWKGFFVLGLGCPFPGPHAINFCTAINQFCGWCEKVFYMCVFATPTCLEGAHTWAPPYHSIWTKNCWRKLFAPTNDWPRRVQVGGSVSVCVCMGALLSGKLCTHALVSSIIFPDNALRAGREREGRGIENDYCHSIGLFSFKTIMIVRLCDTKCGSMKFSNSICESWQQLFEPESTLRLSSKLN